ncbi:MAG: hypothetical protein OK455_10985 [Thaumarchaeota archaeon]|nr:hypothetical protein [Nitrososphaerota archaeon]
MDKSRAIVAAAVYSVLLGITDVLAVRSRSKGGGVRMPKPARA